MKYILLVLGFVLFTNCKNSEENKTKNAAIEGKKEKTEFKLEFTNLDKEQIPKSIKIRGKLFDAKSWIDRNGKNILILSVSKSIKSFEDKEYGIERFDKELYAENYIIKNNEAILLWDIIDFERDCDLGLYVNYRVEPKITDLDKDGFFESTIIYNMSCKSDISPSRLKLLMHENDIKYGLRGQTFVRLLDKDASLDEFDFNLSNIKVELNEMRRDSIFNSRYVEFFKPKSFSDTVKLYLGYKDQTMGRYENENDFKEAPNEFLEYAKKLWRKHCEE